MQYIADLVLERVQTEIDDSMFSIIMDETSDISKTEQVSLCLNYVHEGIKKEVLVGFFETKRTNGESLFNLAKDAIQSLNLDLKNIAGECFDGASNMCGLHGGLATLMKETSPLSIYVQCHAHRLNLALESSLVQNLKNALGTIQSFYNFIGGIAKKVASFKYIEVEGELLSLSLKLLSETRWVCRYEAMRAVDKQLKRIIKMLVVLVFGKYSDAKTSSDAQSLLGAICTFNFIFNLCVLKFILSNTNVLCTCFQEKLVDVFNARKKPDTTISTLKNGRNEFNFTNICEKAKFISENVKSWIKKDGQENEEIQFEEACLPRGCTSDLESYYRVNFFYMGLDQVIGELMYRFQGRDNNIICNLGEICHCENVKTDQFEKVSEFYNLNSELLQCDYRLWKQFLKDHMDIHAESASDLVNILFKRKLFTFLPQLSKIAKIFASIPATSSTVERSFSTLRRLKSFLRSTMGQARLSSIAIINIERPYANRILQESMGRIIDIFGKRKNRQSFLF